MKKDTICLIPAKLNSERCKLKNIRPFAGTSLIEIKIEQAKRVGLFDRIVVNTDSEVIGDIARKHDVDVVIRPQEYTTCGNHEFHQYMAKSLPSSIVCQCNCTSPLLLDKTMIDCVETYKRFNDPTISINTAIQLKSYLFDGDNPINFDMNYFPKSQDIHPIVEYTPAISMADTDEIIRTNGWFMLKKHHFIYVNKIEALDIDYEDDFNICEYFYKRLNEIS